MEAQSTRCNGVAGIFNFVFYLENGGVKVADVEKTIDEYLKALDDAGYQKIMDEFTKQYDAWKK